MSLAAGPPPISAPVRHRSTRDRPAKAPLSEDAVVNAALASGSGSVVGQIGGLNNSITAMNQQITALQKEATQETQELTAQYTVAQATLSQLTTVSNFLSTYFAGASGTGGTL